MNRLAGLKITLAGALFGLLLIAGAASAAPVSAQENSNQVAADELTVSVSLTEVSALTGEKFTFTSEITNEGTVATPPLIVGLNFTSLDRDTYVDPEDWSPRRTLGVAPIEPGASATQSWTINPILEGEIAAYVVVLPDSPSLTAGSLSASPAIRLHVGAQKSLNPGGVLPVVIAVPGVLAVGFAGLRVTSNRWRS
jgi:hypothetical protein